MRAKSTGIGAFVNVIFNGSTTGPTLAQVYHPLSGTTGDQLIVNECTVPVGTTSIDFRVGAEVGTGKAWFGQPTLVNLTQRGF